MNSRFWIVASCVAALAVGLPGVSAAQTRSADTLGTASDTTEAQGPRVGYGSRGFEIESADGNYLLQLQLRFQFRYAFPFDGDQIADLARDQHLFEINRARVKIGGHGFAPFLKYFMEFDLVGARLLDFRLMLEKWPGFRLKVGQWKAHFNRERVISSGRQQTIDRSIVNRFFTVDRQQGISVYGRVARGGAADFSYWASVLTGTGRGASENDDDHLMWLARLQWNFLGRVLPFVGSDLDRSSPTGLIAIGAVTNRSPYTAFSSGGGGQLPGFGDGEPGQYRVKQVTFETAFLAAGFAWQSELHWKEVNDRFTGEITHLARGYMQLGYFLSDVIAGFPRPLEIATRYAAVDQDRDATDDLRREFTLAANWFFSGHNNKLTAELGVFSDQTPLASENTDETRFRLQWDISF